MNSLVIGFGLGKAEIVDNITVYWPSGVIQEFSDIAVNRVLRINESAGFIVSAEKIMELPRSYLLSQNYPNPFNPVTTINYELPIYGEVKISIFNLSGETVALLDGGMQSAGSHQLSWDASEQPSGIYFYRLLSGNFSQTRKMLLIK